MISVPEHMKWWVDARFGVSFHWGLYAIPARGEWVRSSEKLTLDQYRTYFDRFNPDKYNPHDWAGAAKAAGMRYAVLTAKHHDGFCLFDSNLTEYKSTNTPARRDLVREYADAFRAQGIKVGLYYSLVDWQHPDYAAWGDRQHPLREDPHQRDRVCNWENYVRYMHGQVRELLTSYGKIDLLLFDFSYGSHTGEKWGATDLVKMIRQLQPDIVLNDRLGNGEGGTLKDARPPAWAGDFDTCELNMPPRVVTNPHGQRLPWDLWITHNNSWGYGAADQDYKSAADLIRTLATTVSKGGNLLLNLSPDGRGQLPWRSLDDLAVVGQWLDRNGTSIYGCDMAPFERPDWGRFTMSRDGRRLYAHIMEQPMGHLTLPHMQGRVQNPRLLATGAEAFLSPYWNTPIQRFGLPDDIFLNLHQPVQSTYRMPDPVNTVVEMDVVPEVVTSTS